MQMAAPAEKQCSRNFRVLSAYCSLTVTSVCVISMPIVLSLKLRAMARSRQSHRQLSIIIFITADVSNGIPARRSIAIFRSRFCSTCTPHETGEIGLNSYCAVLTYLSGSQIQSLDESNGMESLQLHSYS